MPLLWQLLFFSFEKLLKSSLVASEQQEVTGQLAPYSLHSTAAGWGLALPAMVSEGCMQAPTPTAMQGRLEQR